MVALRRVCLVSGSLFGFLTVALGAFGAHALSGRLDGQAQGWWETAVFYQALHAIALLILGALADGQDSPRLRYAAWGFIIGVTLFSGSLYVMALSDWRWLGMVTPLGGLGLLAGWLLLLGFAIGVRRSG